MSPTSTICEREGGWVRLYAGREHCSHLWCVSHCTHRACSPNSATDTSVSMHPNINKHTGKQTLASTMLSLSLFLSLSYTLVIRSTHSVDAWGMSCATPMPFCVAKSKSTCAAPFRLNFPSTSPEGFPNTYSSRTEIVARIVVVAGGGGGSRARERGHSTPSFSTWSSCFYPKIIFLFLSFCFSAREEGQRPHGNSLMHRNWSFPSTSPRGFANTCSARVLWEKGGCGNIRNNLS